jgi:NADPH:quinone reductase-like Zn-dependent oxidoreductase
MKAVLFDEYGPPGVLRVAEVAEPVAGPGQVLVGVHYSAVNHVDLDIREGISRFDFDFPHVLGIEAAGEVLSVGVGVDPSLAGARVALYYIKTCGRCWFCTAGQDNLCERRQLFGEHIDGTYAEKIVVPAENCLALPATVDYDSAAASVVVFGTAWHALISTARLRPGETVLIHSVGGGVAGAALQVAKLAGARVVATASSDAKLKLAQQDGADLTVNYTDDDPFAVADEITNGRGVDVVFDTVGGSASTKSLQHMAPGGRLISIGAHAGEHVDLDLIEVFRRHISIMGSHTSTRVETLKVLDLIGRHALQPRVHQVFPLSAAAEAHELVARREHYGKVLLATKESQTKA